MFYGTFISNIITIRSNNITCRVMLGDCDYLTKKF
jgi:hypothetical protein